MSKKMSATTNEEVINNNDKKKEQRKKVRNRTIITAVVIAIILLLIRCSHSCGEDESVKYFLHLLGDSEMELTLGEEYIEPGYEVRDKNGNRNEEKEEEVTVEGTVDTQKVGKYKLTYRFEDQTLERYVYVADGAKGDSEDIDSSESTEESESTIEPNETPKPEVTSEPTETEKPRTTTKPTETAIPTHKPQPTNTPDATQNPGVDKPEETPIPTTAPEVTAKPDPKPIEKPAYDMSGVKFNSRTFTYDGNAHSIFISGKLPAGVSVSYSGNGQINAGTTTVTAHFKGDDKHQPIPDKTATLTINKAVYKLSGVRFSDASFTYDGKEHAITATGVPMGISVSYSNNKRTEVGSTTATATFRLREELSKNYSSVSPSSMQATLTITKEAPKPIYDMSGVSFNNGTFTYDGNAHSIFISGKLPAGVSVSYSGNGQINAGTTTVTAHFKGDDKHQPIPDKTATLTINKAVFKMSSVGFGDAVFTYDGQQHMVTASGIPNGITVSYSNNTRTNAGSNKATATFGLSEEYSKNYSEVSPSSLTATLTILKATPDMTGVSFKGRTETYTSRPYSLEITGSLPAGVSVSYIGNGVTEIGSHTITAVFSVADPENWNTPSSMTATLVIEKDNDDNPDDDNKDNPDDNDEDGNDNPDDDNKDNPSDTDEDDEPGSNVPSNPSDTDEDDEPGSNVPSNPSDAVEDDEPGSNVPSNPSDAEEDDEPGSNVPSNPSNAEEDSEPRSNISSNPLYVEEDDNPIVIQQKTDAAIEAIIDSITEQREEVSESDTESLDI